MPGPGTFGMGANPFGGTNTKKNEKGILRCVGFMFFEMLLFFFRVSRVRMSFSLFSLVFTWPPCFHARFFARTREFESTLCIISSLSQRPTHSGSIFRLLLKIAVGLPRSCDSRNFCRASALTITTIAKNEISVCV